VTEAFSFLNELNQIPGVRAGWVERVPDLPISCDRDEAMILLKPHHQDRIAKFSPSPAQWWRAEQVHGTAVAVVPGAPQVPASDGLQVVPGTDGLVTQCVGITLSIYVADCGALWLADRKTGAIGLLHSGKKGTEGNIFTKALETMSQAFGTVARDVTAVLSPCIRPPHYEVNFARDIGKQANSVGIGNFLDCGLNTADDLQRFYSYRREMGKTGRMMAMITRDFLP
jgi:copper oxidase (laccase) domain-containing protein